MFVLAAQYVDIMTPRLLLLLRLRLPGLDPAQPHTSQGQLESGKLERKPWKLEDTNHKVGVVLVLILVVLSQFRSHI